MGFWERLGQALGNRFGGLRSPGIRRRLAANDWWGTDPPGNDAAAYGVGIEEAVVPQGTAYWRAVRVHHLDPEENEGRHHIFLDMLDEAGGRVPGGLVRVRSGGLEHVVVLNKLAGEPGANHPTWKGEVCSVSALGLPSETLDSDRVVGIHTNHPDELSGNTRFHHSFLVIFQRTTFTTPSERDSVLEGLVRNGAGSELLLLREGEPVAIRSIGDDESFRFGGLGRATYVVAVQGSDIRSDQIALDDRDTVVIELVLAHQPSLGAKKLKEYVLFGRPEALGTRTSLLLALDYLLAVQPAFGFQVEVAAAAERVLIVGGLEAVAPKVEETLVAAGCDVIRASGGSRDVLRCLADLVETGWP